MSEPAPPRCPKCKRMMRFKHGFYSHKPKFQANTFVFVCGDCQESIVIEPPLICPDHKKKMRPNPGQKYPMGSSKPKQKYLIYIGCPEEGCTQVTTLETE